MQALALRRRAPLAVSIALAALVCMFAVVVQHRAQAASNLPADKATVTGAKPDVIPSSAPTATELLHVTMKTSTPEDLVLQLSTECSIATDVTTDGTDDQTASAKLTAWVTIDGKEVPIVPPETTTGASGSEPGTTDGHVVFCNRSHRSKTTFGDPPDSQDTIQTFIDTRDANGFNWVALNVGTNYGTTNTHLIQVWGQLDTTGTTQKGHASGIFGARTLVVQPTSYAIGQPSA